MPYDKETGQYSPIPFYELMKKAHEHQNAMRAKIARDIQKYGHSAFAHQMMGPPLETAGYMGLQDWLRPKGDPRYAQDRSEETVSEQGADVSRSLSEALQSHEVPWTGEKSPWVQRDIEQKMSLANKLNYIGNKRKKNYLSEDIAALFRRK